MGGGDLLRYNPDVGGEITAIGCDVRIWEEKIGVWSSD
jgi:hypothetical protein